MKFKKFGKALLMGALSLGVILSVTSCIQSYSVGYLFVVGTATAQSNGSGIITGFKINHNTGQLTQLNGLPVASGGANPQRAVLISNSRFLYVLNRGTTQSGSANCTSTDPCINSNITQFAVGGNGILTAQQTFYTQGINPFRLIADGGGNYLYVLDHDSPNSPNNPYCAAALGNDTNGNPITACGDITAFAVNSTTGRLSLVTNAQATANLNGQTQLTYFPVPANPVDFVLAGGYVITLNGPTTMNPEQSFPYRGGTTTFPYAYASASGQLSLSQNGSQQFSNFTQGTAIVFSGAAVYLLDDEPPVAPNSTGATSQILPFTVGTGGALNAMTGGPVADDPTQTNPIYLMTEAKGKWVYVANFGSNNTGQPAAESGTAGYVIDPSTKQLSFIAGEPWGTGSGPMCLVEDPSNQYIYTANYNDSTVTGRVLDQNAGVLNNLRVANSYALSGPPTWCLISGRTN
jgi:6-phosphogluconolactonase (cycloisomerase 2 family)